MTDSDELLLEPGASHIIFHKHEMLIISSGNVKFSKTLPNGIEKVLALTNVKDIEFRSRKYWECMSF